MQIRYIFTVVGWVNVYHIGTGEVVNINPQQFAELCPTVSKKARLGCTEITLSQAAKLFKQVA
ncbi:hypothetical protein [Rummeliibacillus sp. TYF-LIM-RU47]|uniref:hypothetical protein n=1 Tax=Rummeliibacillus sp. TYF-LIM-RU47 TaxID=2608406 RepID=UPI00123C5757|nr:hypothetical protein [Rummeliibacillus sp. TYF-LIM-RU47]